MIAYNLIGKHLRELRIAQDLCREQLALKSELGLKLVWTLEERGTRTEGFPGWRPLDYDLLRSYIFSKLGEVFGESDGANTLEALYQADTAALQSNLTPEQADILAGICVRRMARGAGALGALDVGVIVKEIVASHDLSRARATDCNIAAVYPLGLCRYNHPTNAETGYCDQEHPNVDYP